MNTPRPGLTAMRRTALGCASWFGCAALFCGGAALAPAHGAAAGLPQAIRAPAGERLVLRTHAAGAQIYVCAAAADGGPQWTLKAPDAELRDARGLVIVHHFAGPAWKHNDGSEVTARAVAHSDAPDHESVPWLLLEAVSHSGNGVLTPVTHIQRVHTHGGLPPPAAECSAAQLGAEARVAYTADYYFYAPGH
jgi:Protein of unknown function (DUF3455)